MKQPLLIGALCGLALCPLLSAADAVKTKTEPVYGSWRACTIGDGGYHQRVIFSPSNPWRYYTYIDTAGVFRSDDAGETWKLITARMDPMPTTYDVRSVEVDPRNEDIVLAAFSDHDGLYRSTDGGGSWKIVLPAVNFYGNGPAHWNGTALAHQPGNPDVVLAATQGTGLFKSTDAGKTWVKKGLDGLYTTHVLFDAKNPQAAWVCAVAEAPKWGPAGNYQGGFYTTDDSGETWRQVGTEQPFKLAQDSSDPDTLYAIFLTGDQIRVSHDRGKTWAACIDGLNNTPSNPKDGTSDSRYRALEAGPGFVLCGSSRGTIYRLNQGEATWKKVPLQSVQYDAMKWVASEHPGGWPPDPFGRPHFFGSAMSNIMVDPRDANHWIIADWYALYQTYDAGSTWKTAIAGIESTAVLGLRQDPTDPQRVYLNMSDNGYFFSDDGGARFKKSIPEFPSGDVKWVDLSPLKPERVWALGNKEGGVWASNQLFVSQDRSLTWKRATMTGLPDPGPLNEAGGSQDVKGTVIHRFNALAVAPKNADLIYVAASGEAAPGQGGVYRSTDGGANWAWFGDGLAGKVFSDNFWTYDNRIVAHPDGTALLTGAIQRIVYRLDGEKWTPSSLDGGGKPVKLAADWHREGTFYAGVPGKGLFLSQDGGATWNLIRPIKDDILSVETDHAQAGRVAFSTKDTVFYSADDGKTWADLDPERLLPCLPAMCLAFAGDRILFATHNCGAYWTTLPK